MSRRRIARRRRSLALMSAGLLLCAASGAARADQANAAEAREWLVKMSEALSASNYEGRFTHRTARQSETLRIVHRVENGRSVERLVSLDGNGREIVRRADEVHCYLPDRRQVLVKPRRDEGSLAGSLPAATPELDAFYRMSIRAGLRLLERDVRLVEIMPRDRYRYGYRLWLDERTAMPLRSIVCDAEGRTIEQIQFTQLAVGSPIPASEIEPRVVADGFAWVREPVDADGRGSAPAPWHAQRLPPGFRLVQRSTQRMPGAPAPAQHLVFSDGLASISVFIESGGRRKPAAAEAPTRMGASSAFSTQVGSHLVTAVGEAPPETVREVANSMAPAGSDERIDALAPRALAPGP
jgi:sigma-E factor negative regulatory protein RseB